MDKDNKNSVISVPSVDKNAAPTESTEMGKGILFRVGCGFLEAVYQQCLEKELTRRSILFVFSVFSVFSVETN